MDIFKRAEDEAASLDPSLVSECALFGAGMRFAIMLIKADFKEATDSAEWAPAC